MELKDQDRLLKLLCSPPLKIARGIPRTNTNKAPRKTGDEMRGRRGNGKGAISPPQTSSEKDQWQALGRRDELKTPAANSGRVATKHGTVERSQTRSSSKDVSCSEAKSVEPQHSEAQKSLNLTQDVSEPKKWENLFDGNHLAARGMNMNFVTPII